MRLFHARSGYLFAVCVVDGDEVVAVVRTDHLVPYPPANLEWIRRNARTLTGCDRVRLIAQDVAALWADVSSDGRTAAVLVRYPKRTDEGHLRLIEVGTGRVSIESPWARSSPTAPRSHSAPRAMS